MVFEEKIENSRFIGEDSEDCVEGERTIAIATTKTVMKNARIRDTERFIGKNRKVVDLFKL